MSLRPEKKLWRYNEVGEEGKKVKESDENKEVEGNSH